MSNIGRERERDSRPWSEVFYLDWSKSVRQRDGNLCRRCKKEYNTKSVHHIRNYHTDPHERFSLQNGILLCCHCFDILKASGQYEKRCEELIHTRKESSIEVLLRLQNLRENQQIAPSGAETRNLENDL